MALAAFSVNVSAILMDDAGGHDELLAQTSLANSGEANEEAWIESILHEDITYTQLSEDQSEGINWQSVSDGIAGDYAFDFEELLGPENLPISYVVIVGGGNGTETESTHFLYNNLESLRYAYINLSDFGEGVTLTNFGIISHAGIVPGTVPAPGPMAIMAIGLVVMGVRQVKKAS